MGPGGRNDSNSHHLARIGEQKIFHELDVHDVYIVGIKRFWAQEAKMSLTDPPEPKMFFSYYVDIMYVEFMKNFLLADSSEVMAVRVISASWAQKRLIPTLVTSCTSSS